jgi:hypothetical protein
MIGASAQLTDIYHHSAMSRAMADTRQLWIALIMVERWQILLVSCELCHHQKTIESDSVTR